MEGPGAGGAKGMGHVYNCLLKSNGHQFNLLLASARKRTFPLNMIGFNLLLFSYCLLE